MALTKEQKDKLVKEAAEAIKNEMAHSDVNNDSVNNEGADNSTDNDSVSHSNEGGDDMGNIKHNNVFDNQNGGKTLSHAEINEIFKDAQSCGSLKEAVLAHTATYGVDNISYLFPPEQLVQDPSTIKRDDAWVSVLLDGVNKRPFARIKSLAFDITAAAARAKGYIKANQKAEEVIVALKRVTTPQTIYKKQKLDRDDIIDITDFDIVNYLRAEMKGMLNEEIARAVLIGDGRLADATDKISESNVRPIASDVDTYNIKKILTIAANSTNKQITDTIIEGALRARKDYKGSGNPIMFTSPDYLTTMLLSQDSMGRKIYFTENELASALRVSKIVEVPVLEGATISRTEGTTTKTYDILGVIVNLKDYTIGADKKGEVTMFDDFDIDYNQNRYLIETRCSGALIKPYSAITLLKEHTSAAG